ncbi:glycosyl hydrolase family 28-related protein [Azospirillum formosense]|uniref:glycosyl hydrolase family 28-related protein n=1 Tax=Azospirillum formosense TaxID=861533 RepID=UPI00338FA8CC
MDPLTKIHPSMLAGPLPPDHLPTYQPRVAGAPARSIFDRLADDLTVIDAGAVCDGSTDDTAAIQRLIDDAAAGAAIRLPARDIRVEGTLTIRRPLTIVGAGRAATRIIKGRANSPLFKVVVDQTIEDFGMSDLSLIKDCLAGDEYIGGPAVLVEGPSTTFFQWSRFENITAYGFHTFFRAAQAPALTPFGYESPTAWLTFNNIVLRPWTKHTVHGWQFTQGSGTGNSFSRISGVVSGAFWRYEGNACVVGDVLISSSHLAGTGEGLGSVAISIGPNTVYRQRVAVDNIQIDAGLDRVFGFDATGSIPYSNMRLVGCNVGGGAEVDLPPSRSMEVADQEVSDWRAGIVYPVLPGGGPITKPLFQITMAAWTATLVEIVATGLVAGVGPSITVKRFALRASSSAITITALTNEEQPAGAITVAASASGGVVSFTATMGITAASTSDLEAQIRATGGRFAIIRTPG